MSECDEIKLKVQALADNELDEGQIPEVVHHIEIGVPEPSREWFEELDKKKFRKFSSVLGKILFFGSYLLLIVYALYTFFIDQEGEMVLKVLVGAVCAGVAVLLGVTIADRVKENKTDKYKGVMK